MRLRPTEQSPARAALRFFYSHAFEFSGSSQGLYLVVMSIITMTFAARDFSARRGASDEDTLQGSVRSEQRSLAEKELPPEGLRRIWPVAALLVGHRSTSGYAPSSRLAPGQIRCNERHRSYAHDHLVSTNAAAGL